MLVRLFAPAERVEEKSDVILDVRLIADVARLLKMETGRTDARLRPLSGDCPGK